MSPARPSRGPHSTHRREPAHPPGRRGPRPDPDRWSDPARRAAYEALAAVHRDDAFANIVLPRLLREHRMGGRDAALATELTYGTLRSLGQLDAILATVARRPVERIDPPARDALRLGAYQLLHTRIPAHAAVATTVDLVRAVAPSAAGFANAVLRRIAEQDLAGWLTQVAPALSADPVAHLALVHSHPEWMVRAFAESLALDLATESGRVDLAEALAANNERPLVHLCARPGRLTAAELADQVGGLVGAYSPYAVYLPEGAPGDLPALVRGEAHVQDEGSQLVALALAAADPAGPDRRWLDLCAGPGGKAALLGALAAQRGARLTAVEVAAHRADLVVAAVAGLPVEVVHADGREVGRHPALPEGGFDRVLVDAPCTGLGSLRRRPESRWRRQPGDLPALTKLQRELLAAALRAVRPGGVVGYVTCSPHLVETRVTVAETPRRAANPPAEPVDARPLLPEGLADLGPGPAIQLWPHRHGTDAMFLALLRRVD
ncbi:MAG TPA: transcription antitermination factor NusB [Micromonosporaceae bacterium]